MGTPLVLACALAATAVVLAAPADAHESSPPKYSLKVVQGTTTQPEDIKAGVSASSSTSQPIQVRILQAGATLYQSKGESGWTGLSQVPVPGEVVTVEAPIGTIVGSVTYDGLPSIENTVCAGSTNFSGQRSGAETVEGGFYTDVPLTNPYGVYGYETAGRGQAQVTLLSGSSFGGSFLTALQLGETVYASEAVEVPLGGGSVFTYESETIRPVGSCPAPPPPPSPPPPPVIPPLQASVVKLMNITIKALLKHGLSDRLYINQPGTVTQDLYLEDGKLPAYAASSHHKHKHKPPALLLARGTASAKAAGGVTVVLHLTHRGRGWLRKAKSAHAVLITTVTGASGVKITLARKPVTLRR
ncbi:MAG TPA: hypothetical protein VMF09_02035 [Solirubrobacteraceae bacterium]|nr:hypothetical protein [Solirubrobacteraceae bacterium]